ncbi:MAG: hypothetical protein F4121_04790 [Acidimicrobiia bacterium]|nr:hypothetical protein [Acidimicrobiia bacterium]MYC46358.1 hypothetical protein [Acidimicrobiia bacterium]MYI19410.1 hypothetical protein [Acidimicrobiia bacterium]
MPPVPGSYNWTQITEMGDGVANRMSREALILVGGLPDTESDATFDYRDGLDSPTAEAVGEIEREVGRSLEFRGVDAGRGAGYLGIAVEVLESIAKVGGASAAVIRAARLVKWAYHKIAERSGRRPMISLGAAEYLAMADVIDRVGSTPRVLGSGDMSSQSSDRAFTGGDAFFVVLATESGLHHYHVSAYGEVFFIGNSPPIRGHWDDPPPYWAGGDGDED